MNASIEGQKKQNKTWADSFNNAISSMLQAWDRFFEPQSVEAKARASRGFFDALSDTFKKIGVDLGIVDEAVLSTGEIVKITYGNMAKDVAAANSEIIENTKSAWNKNKSVVELDVNKMEDVVKFKMGQINTDISTSWKQSESNIKKSTSNISSTIDFSFSGILAKAKSWGLNLASNFSSGLLGGRGLIASAAGRLAGIAASYFKSHSPPEKGPLSTSDKWMPNLIGMFAKGIEMGIPKLEMAIGNAAGSLEVIKGGAATSTNNFNIYPRHANLDAKTLNREMERMRWLNGGAL
jgi:hypothetical protein